MKKKNYDLVNERTDMKMKRIGYYSAIAGLIYACLSVADKAISFIVKCHDLINMVFNYLLKRNDILSRKMALQI
ncbi:hypothetical protein AB7298_13785 [Providencia manganoxydans]|uniref:hypothetical protein n=1 Tax=Providencia TaxID=586 RepID=UPI002349C740|nr:hypothetical protein [Providencia sp. PROV018]